MFLFCFMVRFLAYFEREIFMSKKFIIILFIFSIINCICSASAINPGSASDPLISKSYVDSFLSFRAVELKAGTVVKPNSGGIIVFLSGKIRYVSKTSKELSDLTAGKMVRAGTYLTSNHMYIIIQDADFELQVKENSLAMVFGISDTSIDTKNTEKKK